MSNDTTRDRNTEEDENYEGANPELQDLPLPKTDSMLYLILNSLNQNIANFNAYLKFKNYISEDSLNAELLKRSMGIHRDFSALFCTPKKNWYSFIRNFWRKQKEYYSKGKQALTS